MDDCHQEEYEIFDCSSEFGAIKPLRFEQPHPTDVGWGFHGLAPVKPR